MTNCALTNIGPIFCHRARHMGWLRLVGSLKLYVSFAKEPYKRDHILQKRPVILRSLIIVATQYLDKCESYRTRRRVTCLVDMFMIMCGCVYVYYTYVYIYICIYIYIYIYTYIYMYLYMYMYIYIDI